MRVRLILCLASGSSSRNSAPGESVCSAEHRMVVRSSPLGLNILRPTTKKRVVLSSRSSISVASSLQAVDIGGGFAGDGGRALLVARAARAFGIARHRDARHVGQVLVEPATALRQRLRMAADALDLLQRLHAAHEELVDAQLHLAADPQRRA